MPLGCLRSVEPGCTNDPEGVITFGMQLRVARLCLDCEEVHDAQQCPVCASETFAYLTRWVASPERRQSARAAGEDEPEPEALPAAAAVAAAAAHSLPARKTNHRAMIGYSVLGLGVVGLSRWLLRGREKIESAGLSGAGELK